MIYNDTRFQSELFFLPCSLQLATLVQHSAALWQVDLCSYVIVFPLNPLHTPLKQQQQLLWTCLKPQSPVGAEATLSADSAALGLTPQQRLPMQITDTCGIFTAKHRSALPVQQISPFK